MQRYIARKWCLNKAKWLLVMKVMVVKTLMLLLRDKVMRQLYAIGIKAKYCNYCQYCSCHAMLQVYLKQCAVY